MPVASGDAVVMTSGGVASILIEYALTAVALPLSVTCTVKVKVFATVGVPDSSPVPAARLRPVGALPLTTVQFVYVPVPPVAANCTEYGAFVMPPESGGAVVISSLRVATAASENSEVLFAGEFGKPSLVGGTSVSNRSVDVATMPMPVVSVAPPTLAVQTPATQPAPVGRPFASVANGLFPEVDRIGRAGGEELDAQGRVRAVVDRPLQRGAAAGAVERRRLRAAARGRIASAAADRRSMLVHLRIVGAGVVEVVEAVRPVQRMLEVDRRCPCRPAHCRRSGCA